MLRHDHAESLRFLRQLEKLTPNTGSIYYLIGLTAIRLNRPQETVHVFTEYGLRDHIGGRSYHAWGLYAWARALHMLGEHRKELEIIPAEVS